MKQSETQDHSIMEALAKNAKQRELRKQGPVNLTSVSILCQGYLLVQCSPGGKLVSPSANEPKEIAAIRTSASNLKLQRKNAKDMVDEVESKEYWGIFDKGNALADEIKTEWDVVPTEGFSDTRPLIVKITAGQGVDDPAAVIKGYCAIVRRLGGKS